MTEWPDGVSSRTAAIGRAARWLATDQTAAKRPLLPYLRGAFGISSAEAIEAIRLANRMRETGGTT